jgi:outer membrane protein
MSVTLLDWPRQAQRVIFLKGERIKSSVIRVAVLVIAMLAYPAYAQYEVAEIPFFNTPKGTAALGGGLRLGQDLYIATDNEDQRQYDLVPLYLYNGKYLFFRGTAGGIHLFSRDNIELNVMGRYRFTKLDPDRNAFFEGMETRKQTVDGGVELRLRGRWGEANANYLTDTLNRHKGQSAEVSYRYTFDRGRFSFSPFITWAWNDNKLTNYYYGVTEAEARPDRPEYTPGDSQWLGFGMNSTWWVSDRIQFFANLGFTGVDTVVSDSPLVEEDSTSAFFAGGTYIFGNVRRPEYRRRNRSRRLQQEWLRRHEYRRNYLRQAPDRRPARRFRRQARIVPTFRRGRGQRQFLELRAVYDGDRQRLLALEQGRGVPLRLRFRYVLCG